MLISELKDRKFKVEMNELFEMPAYNHPKEGSPRYNKFKSLKPKIKKLAPYFSDSTDVKLDEFEDTGFPACIKFGNECYIIPFKYFRTTGKYQGHYIKGFEIVFPHEKIEKRNTIEEVIELLKDRCGIGNLVLNNV